MSGFQTDPSAAATPAPDPHRHVKYSLGMVLGVDDFEQEFAYLSHRAQWLARDTIGYGTVCGLKVSVELDERGPRVAVEPGVALNPRGQLIRVTPAQCAYLNDWLTTHRPEVISALGSPLNGQLTLYLVLCYRQCPTDPVPIPGEPCRDETQATVDSRWQDDFELALRFESPAQLEEKAVRDFVAWFSDLEISDQPTSLTLAEFLAAIREAAQLSSPPSPPTDFMYGSPLAPIVLNRADACDYLRAAFRVWVTELRPLWRDAACDGVPAEECVLLAQLDVPLVDGQVSGEDSVIVHEDHRPYVIHVRLLQEWLLCGPKAQGSGLSPATAVIEELTFGQPAALGTLLDQYALADHTHGTPTLPDIPPAIQPGDTVISETAFGQTADAGDAPAYSRADHTHGTPALSGDVGLDDNGELIVTGIGGIPIDLSTLDDGQVLVYHKDTAQWLPGAPGSGASSDAVEHPAGLPRYFIVAAGIVRAAPPIDPLYNNLRVVGLPEPGVITYHFDGYAQPAGAHQYIIKALPVYDPEFQNESKGMLLVNFYRFAKDGFYLRLTDGFGNPIDPDRLRDVAIMIEVSAYRARVEPGLGRARIDLNSASADEISRAVPRIGPALAKSIVALRRKTRGGFTSLDELTAVKGIKDELIRVIEPFVTLTPK